MTTERLPCIGLDCDFPNDVDLYSLDGLNYFTNNLLSFVLECPPGYYCPNFPIPWNAPPGYVPTVYIPPITGNSQEIPIKLRCCENQYVSAVVRVLMQSGPSGLLSGVVTTTESGVPGTVTTIINASQQSAIQTIQTVIQGVVARLMLQCAKLAAACQAENNDQIFPPEDPRNPDLPPMRPSLPVKLSSLSPEEICVNGSYQGGITAISNYAPVTFSIISGSLPPGLQLHTTGAKSAVIIGSPTTAGLYTFEVLAANLSNASVRRTYTICVVEITPATLPDGNLSVAYSETLQATACAQLSLAWFVESGELPPGLELHVDTGVIDGTPTTAGTYNFTVQLVTNAAS